MAFMLSATTIPEAFPPDTPVELVRRPGSRWYRPSGRCLSAYIRVVVKHERTRDVAASFGVTPRRVRYMVAAAARWIERSYTVETLQTRLALTMQLQELLDEVRAAWQKSCSRQVKTKKRVKELVDKKGKTIGGETVTETFAAERDGNPGLAAEVRACVAEICKLWGLHAPDAVELSGPEGGPINFSALLATVRRAAPVPTGRPSNMLDMDEVIKRALEAD